MSNLLINNLLPLCPCPSIAMDRSNVQWDSEGAAVVCVTLQVLLQSEILISLADRNSLLLRLHFKDLLLKMPVRVFQVWCNLQWWGTEVCFLCRIPQFQLLTRLLLTALNSLPNSRLLQYLITIISIMDKFNRTRDTLALRLYFYGVYSREVTWIPAWALAPARRIPSMELTVSPPKRP